MAQQVVEARNLAAELPVDYRLLTHAAVVAATVPDDHEMASHSRVYLTVLGKDPDEKLTSMLVESGHTVFPGSENPGHSVEVNGEKTTFTVGPVFGLSVSWIRPMGDDLYRVETSYYCGTLCAGQNDYIVRATDDGIEVVRVERGWVS